MKKILIITLIILCFTCAPQESEPIYITGMQLGSATDNIDFDYYTGDMPDWYGVVVRVADGDTFYIDFFSEKKMGVRIFGIDTPETVDNRKEVQYWGPEASKFSKQYLQEGTVVKLNFDGEITGPFGRLLAEPWVLKDGEWVNYSRVLLETGNAFVYANYYVPIDKLHEYLAYQQYAVENKLGMWAHEELIENDIVKTKEDIAKKYSWYRKLQ